VVSCKGTTCQFGLYDTFGLAEEIHNRFYLGYHSVKLPHKFKIACGGCPNNCVKPDINDLGIVGQKIPGFDGDKCKGCSKCKIADACPMGAASVEDKLLQVDKSKCNNCGRCIGKCPFDAVAEGTPGFKVYIGGRWGKKVAQGKPLSKIFTDREEVLRVVESAILLFREQGLPGERFGDTINRIGFEKVEAQLLSGELLARKDQIIGE
jgi:dissimilatory sulfite reductase (desulfoviridin) alpha/beta subunit